jgi:hypothetical protein
VPSQGGGEFHPGTGEQMPGGRRVPSGTGVQMSPGGGFTALSLPEALRRLLWCSSFSDELSALALLSRGGVLGCKADLPVAVASPPCLTSRAFTSSIAGSRHCSTCHLFSEPACGAFLVTIGVSFLLGFDVDHFAPFLRVTLLQVVGARPLLLIYLHFFFVPFVSLRRF